jgi:hypothetical protein
VLGGAGSPARCELDITKIKCVIPHQANRRIIDAVGERLGATPEQMFINVHRYGNTSAASVAIALDEAVSVGKNSARRLDPARGFRRRPDLGRGGHRMVKRLFQMVSANLTDSNNVLV